MQSSARLCISLTSEPLPRLSFSGLQIAIIFPPIAALMVGGCCDFLINRESTIGELNESSSPPVFLCRLRPRSLLALSVRQSVSPSSASSPGTVSFPPLWHYISLSRSQRQRVDPSPAFRPSPTSPRLLAHLPTRKGRRAVRRTLHLRRSTSDIPPPAGFRLTIR